MHEHARLLRKEGDVGVEEIGAEPEDDHSGFGQLDREGIFDAPVIGSVANHDAGLGAVTAAYMLEERENDGKDDALLDAKNDHGSGGDEGQGEFVRFGALNFSQAAMVDKFDADMEDDGGEDDVGEKAKRPSEKEENREDHSGSGEVRPLTAAARGSTMAVLVGLPLTTKVLLQPAATLERERPMRSTFWLNWSRYLSA